MYKLKQNMLLNDPYMLKQLPDLIKCEKIEMISTEFWISLVN